MTNADEAVSALESLGLTEYEARCFVALTRISKGTAKEISRVADVPRSRVYDTVERLDRRGLVEIQQSDPREYKAIPVSMATRRIREDYDSRINAAENALQQVEAPDSDVDEGMWSITKSDHVTDRVLAFLDEAEGAIHHLVAAEEVIEQRIVDRHRRASDRGVSVTVEVPNEDVGDRFRDALSDDEVVVAPDLETTDRVYSEWPGQLLMVDERAIVAAGVQESDLPGVTQQMAVWTYGRDHGFAVWTRELLDDRLERRGEER